MSKLWQTLLTVGISVFAFLVYSRALCSADDGTGLGFSKTKPASGKFVEVDGGYLVGYRTMLPGTEVEYEMIPVPGGTVMLGSPESQEGRKADEGPQVSVAVGPMWVGKCEIAWQQYKVYMSMYSIFKKLETDGLRKVAEGRLVDAVTAPTPLYEAEFTFEFGDEPELPAVTMTQFSAKQFTKWLSKLTGRQYRLPTEAEWEYACRAGSTTAFAHGDDVQGLDEFAWHVGNAEGLPHKVGLKKPNAWGLHDMHGNVMEWTVDGYDPIGYGFLKGKVEPVSFFDAIKWPDSAEKRVVRGGSWQDEAGLLRSAARLASSDEEWKSEDPNVPLSPWWYTSDPARGVGFRLFRGYKELTADQIQRFWEIDNEDIGFDVKARMEEGRGVHGLVDSGLIKVIQETLDN